MSGRGGLSTRKGGNDVSLTVEETNRLRAELGLRPLRVDSQETAAPVVLSSKGQPFQKDRWKSRSQNIAIREIAQPEAAPATDSGSVRDRTSLGLADSDKSDDDDDPAAWVTRMRERGSESGFQPQSVNASKIGVCQTGTSANQERAPGPTEEEKTSSVKLRHSELGRSQVNGTVLTFADAEVLDVNGNELNEDSSLLESLRDREVVSAARNARLRSGEALAEMRYDPTDDAEFGPKPVKPNGGGVLEKYDSAADDLGFSVGFGGKVDVVSAGSTAPPSLLVASDEVPDLDPPRVEGGTTFDSSLDSQVKLTSLCDHYSVDEYVSLFKKKGKSRTKKKRKRAAEILDGFVQESEGRIPQNSSAHVYERPGDASMAELLGENERTERQRELRLAASRLESDENEIEDDDDFEIQDSLERSRRLALQASKGKMMPTVVESVLEKTWNSSFKPSSASLSGETVEPDVIVTEAEHFVRNIGISQTEGSAETEIVPRATAQALGDDLNSPAPPSPQKSDSRVGAAQVDGSQIERKPTLIDPVSKQQKNEDDILSDSSTKNDINPMGTAHTLARLRNLGELRRSREQAGRARDERLILSSGDKSKDVKLTYKDDQGRDLTPKEAFRIMSHKFHGKGPGQNKREARMRRQLQERDVKLRAVAEDTPLASVAALLDETKRTRAAHVVLSGSAAIQSVNLSADEAETGRVSCSADPCATPLSNSVSKGSPSRRTTEPSNPVCNEPAKVEFSLTSLPGPALKRTRR